MRCLIFLVTLLFLVSFVAGAGLEISYDAVVGEVLPGDTAVFNLKIRNLDDEKIVEIASKDLNWKLIESKSEVTIKKGGLLEMQIKFEPIARFKPGRYGVNLMITSDRDSIEQYIPVTVLANSDVLDVAFISSPNIDPRKETIVKLNVKNKYNINLGNVDIELSGPDFSQATKALMGPGASEAVEFQLNLDENLQEGEHDFHVKIIGGNEVYVDKDFKVNVARYSDFKEVVTEDDSFLYKKTIVSLKNEGNALEEDAYTKRLSLFEKWFTHFNPKPSRIDKKEGMYYAVWDVSLESGASQEIKIITNYRLPLGIVIVVVLLLLAVWYWKKRAVTVKRKVVTVKKRDGIAVHTNIIIKSDKNVKEVRVMERIGHVIGKPRDFGFKPSEVKTQGNSLVIYWDLKSLAKNREVNLSYTVDCASLDIPPTVVRYSEGENRFIALSEKVKL